MSRVITQIEPSSTFQDWYNTTNDLADAFLITATLGEEESNVGELNITGSISTTSSLATDLIIANSINDNIVIRADNITVDGQLIVGTTGFTFDATSEVDPADIDTLTIGLNTKKFIIDTIADKITAENLEVDNAILPANLYAETFISTEGLITLDNFPISAETITTDPETDPLTTDVKYGNVSTRTQTLQAANVDVIDQLGARGTTDTNVTGNVTGDILSNDTARVLNNGSALSTAWFKGHVQSHDGTNIITNGATNADVIIDAPVINSTTVTSTDFIGNLTGNVTGDLTGDVTGDVKATNGTLILDSGNGTTVRAEYIGDVIGDVKATDDSVMVDSSAKTFTGDLTGDVKASNNSVMVDSSAKTFTGDLYTGDVFGNVNSTGLSIFTNINVNGGEVDNTPIGSDTPSTGAFTNLTANAITGDLTGDVRGNLNGNVTGNLVGNTNGLHTGSVIIPEDGYLELNGAFTPPENFYTVPKGGIIYWSDDYGPVPNGWGVCDGSTYSYLSTSTTTPDLRDKFVRRSSAVCISVCDESSGTSASNISSRWNSFRNKYPDVPFYLLSPGYLNRNSLKIPAAFNASQYSYVQQVNSDNGNSNSASDWFAIASLANAPRGSKVYYSIDTSGSTTKREVSASISLLLSRCASAGLQVIERAMSREDWIGPFSTIDASGPDYSLSLIMRL